MFGSSTGPTTVTKEEGTATHQPSKSHAGVGAVSEAVPIKPADGGLADTVPKSNGDSTEAGAGGKRRSSGFAKVLKHLSGSPNSSAADNPLVSQHTTLQKLGKTDPALSVPQGSLNNSAGESRPGPRSTFRVGVTEDKNKKCRRTMEDTHAYLYNFLSTPAPLLGPDWESSPGKDGLGPTDDGDSQAQGSHVVETDNGYFAIFDGHAGTFAADWCGKKLHVLLEDMIRKHPNTPVPELLDQTFTNVDQQLEKLPVKNSGCTAITAVLRWEDRIPNAQSATGSSAVAPVAAAAAKAASESAASNNVADGSAKSGANGKSTAPSTNASSIIPKLQDSASRHRVLYTANVGDARIVLCRNGKALRLSYDHKGSDENEGKRISNAGGLILNNRVNGVLAVTRALGDAYMKDLVTGHPYTTETVIQPDIDEFLILACDGLWDVCTDQEAVDLVRHTQDPQFASKQLVDHALARFSTDNLSCMIVRFDSKALQQTTERRTGPIGVEGDPPSSIKGGISEADAIVKEARRSMNLEDERKGISREIIKEEDPQGTGPELKKQLPRDTSVRETH